MMDRRSITSRANLADHVPASLDAHQSVVLTIRMPARYVAELDRLAADVDTTRSEWARAALIEAIDPWHQLTPRTDP